MTKTVRRGRPKKLDLNYEDTREALLQAGLVSLTTSGFIATGLGPMLRAANIPKGSFYHYFDSKEAFGLAVLARYREYFERKLARHLLNDELEPLLRLKAFMSEATLGLEKYDYCRGCLVGNLEQEVSVLSESMRDAVLATYASWECYVAACLRLAIERGELSGTVNTQEFAQMFWVGWEGAIARARLLRSSKPLKQFEELYFQTLIN